MAQKKQKKAAKPAKKVVKKNKTVAKTVKKAAKKPEKKQKVIAKPKKAEAPAVKTKEAKKTPDVKPVAAKVTTPPPSKEVEELEALLNEDDSNDVELRDAEGRLYCRVRECDELSTVEGYCRYHYLRLWKKIQLRKKILADGKLDKYIEDLTQRYPDKFVEMIRNDLKTEKDFLAAIQELDIDEAALDNEMEEDQGLLDEVRGVHTGGEDSGDEF